ncbi:MAG: hypothetical protein ACXABY_03265 [Candidatus Thorarchaeota archaeon]|jgi:hypothetical protein
MITIKAKFRGTSPLMMNPMNEATLLSIRDKTPVPKKMDETPDEEAARNMYREDNNPKGKIGIPVECLFACTRDAGVYHKYGSPPVKISTGVKTSLPAFIRFQETFFMLTNGNGKTVTDKDWVTDVRMGKNKEGQAICIVRPKFKNWGFQATLIVDDSQIPVETVRNLMVSAGSKTGLMAFRPAKKGTFGCFEIVDWKVSGNGAATAPKSTKRGSKKKTAAAAAAGILLVCCLFL